MRRLKRLSKAPFLRDRRKDSVERLRREREIEEERRKRIETLRPDLGPFSFW